MTLSKSLRAKAPVCAWAVLFLMLILGLVWVATAEQRQWEQFVKEHHCQLFSSKESFTYPITRTLYHSDGTVSISTEYVRFPGKEIWECLGPEGIDTYHRWK